MKSKNPTLTPARKTPASALFAEALSVHGEARSFAQQAKVRAITAGWLFLQAKAACQHGEFVALCEQHEQTIPLRTVQAYMQFAEDALVSVIKLRDGLSDADVRRLELTDAQRGDADLLKLAQEAVLHRAEGYVALAREFAILRKFGEYDAIRHQLGKVKRATGHAEQLEFSWAAADIGVRSLAAISLTPAEKLPPRDKLLELESQLLAALQALRGRLATIEAEASVTLTPANQ